MDFNPQEITYEELLRLFLNWHSPEYNVATRQYVSAIFYHNENQKEAAIEAINLEQQKNGIKLYTLMLPYEKLYLAEAYHQKYYLQLVDVLKQDIKSYYPNIRDFIDSTTAARINGYIKGLGTMDQLVKDIELMGLSEKGKKRLIEIVDSY